ncbi:hypothetical protein PYW07_016590 [Mythimna separata]|uniref:Lysozyme n=1 Tax=Mythimna separata TaxID=271217 RepID=A0AAD7YKT5_MYTSE|nr:hypothetical protein PYW07_016590 [Mythimna separata]
MSRAILLVVLLCFMSKTFGKILSECDLVWELRKQSIPENEIKDWVCLVNAASSRQTDLVGPPGSDGSNDYGIYQISDRYWCETDDKPGKGCSVRCKDLLRDDITAQIECSKIIHAAHGFEAWFGWAEKCKGQTLPEIQC